MSLRLPLLGILAITFICEAYGDGCSLHYNPISDRKKELLNKISSLFSQSFVETTGGFTYALTICSDVSKDHPGAAATKSTNKNTTVIGRLNDTHITSGSDWILLTYGSGDNSTSVNCHNSNLRSSVMITCNRDSDDVLFSLNDDDASTDCLMTFSLKTPAVCSVTPQPLSRGSVFCILLLTGGMMYLVIGVAYRRIMLGAQGVEQIPHYSFWSDLGNLQADGCNFLCRKRNSREEPWNRITSNFNDPADEPLLHP